jgi:RNA polymerase sigma-70 factor (ECF subfamily)
MIKGWLNTASHLTPEQWLSGYITTGERKYIRLLVEQFNHALYHYLLSQSNKETAEDVIQSTWLKVMNTQQPLKENSQVKSWLYTIARNTLIDELRRQQRWQWHPIEEQVLTSVQLEHSVNKNDQLALFNFALGQLPFHQREAFIFQQDGFSIKEICSLVNEEHETVKSRLRYARNNIKKILRTKQ